MITNLTLNQVIDIPGAEIVNQQGQTLDGNEITHTRFQTVPNADNQDITIQANLTQIVESYYDDETDMSGSTMQVLNQIKSYADQIKCTSFQGKGTIDDYTELFTAASKIATDSKQMALSVDLSGLHEFGQAADDLSKLFTSFIRKLESVNIINDLSFLQSIASALLKIVNLVNVFGKFKETILATSRIEFPKSAHDATVIVQSVLSEVNCAMTYISHFVDPSFVASDAANLSFVEQNIVKNAVRTIDNWNILCEQDVTIAMSNSPDVIAMKQASASFQSKTSKLMTNTSTLRGKLSFFNVLN